VLKVLFANNYSMQEVRRLSIDQVYPKHHLWGADFLEENGLDVTYVPFNGSSRLHFLSTQMGNRLGSLDQQTWILRNSSSVSVYYGAALLDLKLIALMRYLRLLRIPLVQVVSFPAHSHVWNKMWVDGIDVAICLNKKIQQYLINEFGRTYTDTPVVQWGPDLHFSGYIAKGEEYIVSMGKTGRDIQTLVKALHDLPYQARIFVKDESIQSLGERITLIRPDRGLNWTFREVLEYLQRASVVAIPLRDDNCPYGLSELLDALALAKPVLMTRNDYIDIDIERIGCGYWDEPGDVNGWRKSLDNLLSNPSKAREMGRRGRLFVEQESNYGHFCRGITLALQSVAYS